MAVDSMNTTMRRWPHEAIHSVDATLTCCLVARDFDARAVKDALSRVDEGSSGILDAIDARAEAHSLRFFLYALLEEAPTIECVHLEAALALWE